MVSDLIWVLVDTITWILNKTNSNLSLVKNENEIEIWNISRSNSDIQSSIWSNGLILGDNESSNFNEAYRTNCWNLYSKTWGFLYLPNLFWCGLYNQVPSSDLV